ncbi:MAG: flagellar basal body P-ring formation protein FlgA [Azoarcus sp.]|jgi:flagella basal body P-ring formation protein FlgA|nr:flagellar basal body P-ring formation protein FlgA [Azoarcus sp.]
MNVRASVPAMSPRLRRLTAFAAFAATANLAAQQPPAPVETAAREFIEARTRGLFGEVVIEIGPLDPANQLPPCEEPAAFLPASTRAWGALSIGVRCEKPVAWTVYLQARVKVIADYVALARPLRAGQIVGPGDLGLRRGDLAALPDDVLTDASQAAGRHARYALAKDSPLQTRMLRTPAVVQQGGEVTVFSRGAGFQASNTGRALNSAAPGEAVRVRLPDNRVVTGMARTDGAVELAH